MSFIGVTDWQVKFYAGIGKVLSDFLLDKGRIRYDVKADDLSILHLYICILQLLSLN